MRRGLIARSKTELPDAVFDARLERLRAAMRELDALLVYTNNTRPAAVSWLTGFIPYWSEAMLVVPRNALPVLVVALTFRVKPWIERTSRVAEVINAPRVGIEAARLIAGRKADAAVGVVDFDHLPLGIADDLGEAGPQLAMSDASDLFAMVRAPADPARSEEHTSELQSQSNLVCRLLLEKKKKISNEHQSDKKKHNFKK